MRLLREYSNADEAKVVARSLRERGVLTFVSSQYSAAVLTLGTGAGRIGLWVVFDEQFTDAVKIISGVPCKVAQPLTEKEMQSIEVASKQTADQRFQSFIKVSIAGLVVFVLIILILMNILHSK